MILCRCLFLIFLLLIGLTASVDAKQSHKGEIYHLVEATEEQAKLAQKYFANRGEVTQDDEDVPTIYHLAEIDLNDAGLDSYLVVVENVLWCGTIGCSVDAWQKVDSKWRYLGSVGGGHCRGVKRLKSMTLGYHDLEACGEISRWNGQEYR